MHIINVKEHPKYLKQAITYFQSKWANEASLMVYEDCITHAITSKSALPNWYLLIYQEKIIGCAGLITNDFISRMDLWPWICALYIEEEHQGHHYSKMLLDRAKADAKIEGFSSVYLCTDHIGLYEKYDFNYIGTGYHPWGESSRIYEGKL